jgi:hypothetical protein
MDLGLRIIEHPDRRSELPVGIARQIANAIEHARPIAHSVATDGKQTFAYLSVRPFRDPLTGSERFGVLLTGGPGEIVVADAPAKRHAIKAYRQLVHLGHERYWATAHTPYAWDYSDVPGIPTNLGADRG